MSDNSRATPMTFRQVADIEQLAREIDSCGECRLEIGGPDKYKVLNTAEIITIVDGLALLSQVMEPGKIQQLGKLETTRSANTRPVMILERLWDIDRQAYAVIDKQAGMFHAFGADFLEFENGPANFSTAIVELPDGTVQAISCTLIRFLDAAA